MKNNVPDRLAKLEKKIKPAPAAWLTIIAVNGSVSAKHRDHGSHNFDSMEDFDLFMAKNGFESQERFSIIIVSAKECQGADPAEL